MNFALVHIGTNLRDHINDCIRQITITNPSSHIYVLTNTSEISKVHRGDNVTVVALEALPISMKHDIFRKHYHSHHTGVLWKYSTERFFYLETFMTMYRITDLCHMEYDNMIYIDTGRYKPIFQNHFKNKLGCTFDADHRGIAGFLFISSPQPLTVFTNFIVDTRPMNRTDMDYLALFREAYPDFITALPIVPSNYAHPLVSDMGHVPKDPDMFKRHFAEFQCIFDAAAIGQYLGGIDPIHNKPDSIGFINETCVFQCSKMTFSWEMAENGLRFPFVICGDSMVPIANLHIHCKNLRAFRS